MCVRPQPGDQIVSIRCQPVAYPCPTCGRRGHRKRRRDRFVRSLAYGCVLWLHVFYAEYTARCACRKSFRSCPPNIVPKADYDNLVREAVLNRILDDGLNVERTRAAMKRDFLLDLSSGFIYDCLNWGLARLRQTGQRNRALKAFRGVLCIDELHLGKDTLLLATDPIADRVVGYSLVRINDQAHMRCFVRKLQYWGFDPKVVVTDGSNLYPAVLAEVWPDAKQQLCVFHVLQDVTNKVLAAVRRLRRSQARRGNGGRPRPGSALQEKCFVLQREEACVAVDVCKCKGGKAVMRKPFSPQDLQNIRQLAAQWGKIVARRAFGDEGPGLGTTLEEVAQEAARGLVEGTLTVCLEQQANDLGDFHPCPDCGRHAKISREPRTVYLKGGQSVPLSEPVCHCPDCRRDFFPPAADSGSGQPRL
jgi:ssDNA-binding Zn-finger/Zn-ribbon topoisomerase 1